MSDKIFLVQGDKLVAMERSKYSLEDHLQDLLARYPDLMPGEQLNSAEPRRWLLVSREIGVPDSEAAIDRWSLDHLFLDQDGVPTLVEAKRSTDPRIRREVIGQMIEYASNAQSYWNVQQIRDLVIERAIDQTEDGMLLQSLGVSDVEEFWQKVKSNLQSGRLRLIFVADEIPRELKRMIEFLNTQMDPAEVYGIELPQFLGGEMQTIVPRLVGNTAQAVERKSSGKRIKHQWDESSFFTDLVEHQGAEDSAVVHKLYDWFQEKGLRIWWGEGIREASFVACLDVPGHTYNLIRMTSRGWFSIMIDFFRERPAFKDRDIRKELIEQINSKTSIQISLEARRPNISTESLRENGNWDAFLEILDSLMQEIRGNSDPA